LFTAGPVQGMRKPEAATGYLLSVVVVLHGILGEHACRVYVCPKAASSALAQNKWALRSTCVTDESQKGEAVV
jgi:hypothetical protein